MLHESFRCFWLFFADFIHIYWGVKCLFVSSKLIPLFYHKCLDYISYTFNVSTCTHPTPNIFQRYSTSGSDPRQLHPEPDGTRVQMTVFCDIDHAHDLSTGISVVIEIRMEASGCA